MMPPRVRLLLVLFVAMSARGCAPADDDGSTDAWVDLGVGLYDYHAVADGDPVPIVRGPQGGHMIALAVRAAGVEPGDPDNPGDPGNPTVRFEATLDGAADRIGSLTQRRGMVPAPGEEAGAYDLFGAWLVFDGKLDTAVYFDAAVHVAVTLTDAAGVTVSAERTLLATAP